MKYKYAFSATNKTNLLWAISTAKRSTKVCTDKLTITNTLYAVTYKDDQIFISLPIIDFWMQNIIASFMTHTVK